MAVKEHTILITRPESVAHEFVEALQALGYQTLTSPVLNIVPLDVPMPDLQEIDALVLTSANAVRVLADMTDVRDVMTYAVGKQTAISLSEHGFENIISADGDLSDLEDILEDAELSTVLHVRGQNIVRPIACLSVIIQELVVYQADLIDRFTADTINAFKAHDVSAVTLFSRRTTEQFLKIISTENLWDYVQDIKFLCISDSVVKCLRPYVHKNTYASRTPDREGMIELIQTTCV